MFCLDKRWNREKKVFMVKNRVKREGKIYYLDGLKKE